MTLPGLDVGKYCIALLCVFATAFWVVNAGISQTDSSGSRRAPKYKVIEVENGGSITGHVTYVGEPPKPEVIKTTKDQAICGTKQTSEAFIVSPDTKGIKNAVVYLVKVRTGKALAYTTNDKKVITPESSVTLTQEGCVYAPHLQAAFFGSTLNVVNGDKVLHNVHAYKKGRPAFFRWHPKSTLFNFAQAQQGQKVPVNLDTEGLIGIKCDVHNWMESYIYVAAHPYFDITDDNGRFEMTDIPPGKYRLEMWQESIGTIRKDTLVVNAGEEITVDFPIQPVAE